MNKKYNRPEIEVVVFDIEDITNNILSGSCSGGGVNSGNNDTEHDNGYTDFDDLV